MNSGAASPRFRQALRPVHWRSQIVIAAKVCEISKASRQRSSAIRFPACQRSTGEDANGLTDEASRTTCQKTDPWGDIALVLPAQQGTARLPHRGTQLSGIVLL